MKSFSRSTRQYNQFKSFLSCSLIPLERDNEIHVIVVLPMILHDIIIHNIDSICVFFNHVTYNPVLSRQYKGIQKKFVITTTKKKQFKLTIQKGMRKKIDKITI